MLNQSRGPLLSSLSATVFISLTLLAVDAGAQAPPPPQLVVTSVAVSANQTTLYVTGQNLVKSGNPTVSVGGSSLLIQSATGTNIVASLTAPLAPGSYRLVVTRGPRQPTTGHST